MSKIIELIEVQREKLNNHYLTPSEHLYEVGILEGMKLMASTIKAEVMGLKPIKYLGNGSTSANGKYNDNFHPMTQTSGEPQHINRSDLENLFKESE